MRDRKWSPQWAAWAFLAPKQLDEDARYKPYTIFKNGNTVSIVPAKP